MAARAKTKKKTAPKARVKKKTAPKKKSVAKKTPPPPFPKDARCFVVKSEPFVYSFDQLVADGKTSWTGVRNFEARMALRHMKKGDLLFYYHSNEGKAVVGLARVAREAYQDTTTDEDWSTVDIVPVRPVPAPMTLAALKAHPVLKNMALVRKGRISVTPVLENERRALLEACGLAADLA